jgi:hypothetical protein
MMGGRRTSTSREIKEELSIELISRYSKIYGVFQAHAHGHPETHLLK